MATLTDEQLETTEAPEAEPNLEDIEVTEEAPPQEEVEEKYRGKSASEIIAMHKEAEKLIGRQAKEVGELRGLTDNILKSQLTPQPEVEEEVDFFTDPEKAIEKAIAQHPSVKQAETAAAEMHKQAVKAQLQATHPDYEKVMQDPAFAEWVKSSEYRMGMFQQADRNHDFNAANELFSNWKERQQVVAQTASVEEQSRKQKVKQASTGNTRSNAEAPSRKFYRRIDLIKLMKEDPSRYDAMQPDIMKAYAEGRVK